MSVLSPLVAGSAKRCFEAEPEGGSGGTPQGHAKTQGHAKKARRGSCIPDSFVARASASSLAVLQALFPTMEEQVRSLRGSGEEGGQARGTLQWRETEGAVRTWPSRGCEQPRQFPWGAHVRGGPPDLMASCQKPSCICGGRAHLTTCTDPRAHPRTKRHTRTATHAPRTRAPTHARTHAHARAHPRTRTRAPTRTRRPS
jgi:hypothetical protein